MPCIKENHDDVDVALQILDAVTPHINLYDETDSAAIRETTQTDHLNKHLLKTFLERLNVMAEVTANHNVNEDFSQEFDD